MEESNRSNSYGFYIFPLLLWQGERFSLSQQVLNFENNLNDLRNLTVASNLTTYLAKSIVIMVFGSNDYINNYLMPSLYNSSSNYNPQNWADLLLNRYARQILVMYHFQVHSVGSYLSTMHAHTCILFYKPKQVSFHVVWKVATGLGQLDLMVDPAQSQLNLGYHLFCGPNHNMIK